MGDIDLKELTMANELMAKLREGGADIKGVVFASHGRKEDPSVTNSQVLEWLRDGGRDFKTITDDEVKEIEDAFIHEVERRMERLGTRDIKSIKNTMNSILVSGLKASLMKIISIIHTRIERGTVAGGASVKQLSEEYSKVKQRKHGFTKPIGKATGQLLENLSQDVKNIKVIK
jgi:hypothetical protein